MSEKKSHLGALVPVDMHKRIKVAAAQAGKPIAVVMVEAMTAWLDDHEERAPAL